MTSSSYIEDPVNQIESKASIILKTPGNDNEAYKTLTNSSGS